MKKLDAEAKAKLAEAAPKPLDSSIEHATQLCNNASAGFKLVQGFLEAAWKHTP